MQILEIDRRLQAIVSEARKQGIPATITSRYRSIEKQRAMYNAWVAGGRKGLPVARPGLSTHNYGIAGDISFPPGKEPEMAAIASRNGMVWFGPKDRVHFDLFGPSAWNALLRRLGVI